jgi:hypothetical protein
MDVGRDRDGSGYQCVPRTKDVRDVHNDQGVPTLAEVPTGVTSRPWRSVIAREQEPLLRNVAARKVSVGATD